ncbi:mitochondrial metal transporter [Coemansia spiralis]|nr:mitochondrial metal transporter [Coemansia spiralis]
MSARLGSCLGKVLPVRARAPRGVLCQRSQWSTREQDSLVDAASSFSSFSRALRKEHSGHSHSHSHGLFSAHSHGCGGEAAAKIDLIEHSRAGSRITLVGIGANIGMGAAKGVAGVYFHSSALLADAAHSMSDILSDVVTLYTFRKSRRAPDAVRPFGYGRYEALGTLVVSTFLIAAGFGIGSHALEHAAHMLPDIFGAAASSASAAPHAALESARTIAEAAAGENCSHHHAGPSLSSLLPFGHSHGAHVATDGVVDPRAIWFAAGSIVVNEVLFRATRRVGERTKSDVLLANAWHHRSDALTSLVSMGAIGGAIVGFPILDAVGGLVVSAMLAKSGISMLVGAVREVTDAPPPPDIASDVARAVAEAVRQTPAVCGHADVRCRKSGPFVHVHLRLRFAPTETAAGVARAVAQVRAGVHDRADFVQSIEVDIDVGTGAPGSRDATGTHDV